jgi:hypothetical protein
MVGLGIYRDYRMGLWKDCQIGCCGKLEGVLTPSYEDTKVDFNTA